MLSSKARELSRVGKRDKCSFTVTLVSLSKKPTTPRKMVFFTVLLLATAIDYESSEVMESVEIENENLWNASNIIIAPIHSQQQQ